jgi:hypothetical protein
MWRVGRIPKPWNQIRRGRTKTDRARKERSDEKSLGIDICVCSRSIAKTCLAASCISKCHGGQKKIASKLAMFLVRFQGGSEVRTQSSAPAALNIDDIIPNSFMQEPETIDDIPHRESLPELRVKPKIMHASFSIPTR